MKISLCIETYNEAANIHYALDSAYNFVDEVVIVDGGSTDRTVEIAKSYGNKVKVIVTTNPPMFHINKQKAIVAARGEWILQLDADEAITDELKLEISSVVSQSQSPPQAGSVKSVKKTTDSTDSTDSTNFVAFWLPRKNFFLNRFLMKGGQYPDYTIRLYKNGCARFPCKSVHENVEIINPKSQTLNSKQIQNSKFQIGYLKNPLLHYADPNFSRYLMRWHRYNNLDAKQLLVSSNQLSVIGKITQLLNYLIAKPFVTFFMMYFRHKGFMDGRAGFIFAFFSSIRFLFVYLEYLHKK